MDLQFNALSSKSLTVGVVVVIESFSPRIFGWIDTGSLLWNAFRRFALQRTKLKAKAYELMILSRPQPAYTHRRFAKPPCSTLRPPGSSDVLASQSWLYS